MKQFGFAVIFVLSLVACSSREDREAKNQPISIQKAQIDVAESDLYLNFARPGTQARIFCLTNTVPEDEEANWKRVKTMSGRTVQITNGREVLGTGYITGLVQGKAGTKEGLDIAFPSPEALEELERKLGFKMRYVLAEGCVTNMTRIVNAARAWAHSHNEVLPSDFLAMQKEIGFPMVLVCPSDMENLDKKVWDWRQLNTNHLTYQIVSPGASENESTQIYLRCPIHGLAAYADGSVRKLPVK